MFDASSFSLALGELLTWQNLLLMLFGTFFGIFCGAMPGLSSTMALTIMVPFTFSMSGYAGILCLLGIFCGSIYGGSITAILINTPGTSNSAATCLDGYPMTLRGEAGRALGMSTFASTFGGIFSALCLFITAPLLAKFALNFGAPENFALAVFGLSIVTSISSDNLIKGLLSMMMGLMISNGLVALAGGLLAQYQGFSDINMGRGAIVIGLAAVIIGEVIFSRIFRNFALKLLSAVIGAIIYYIVMVFVLRLGLSTDDLKLLTALVVALFLTIPYWKGKYFTKTSVKKGEKNHA